MADDCAEEDYDGQRHNPSWCIMRECGLESSQFNWFYAAMRFCNSLVLSNRSTARTISQADMQLSSQRDDCSFHISSAMDDLSFCREPQGEALGILGTFFLCASKRVQQSSALLIINGAPSLQRGSWSCIRHTSFPSARFLTFLVTLFAA